MKVLVTPEVQAYMQRLVQILYEKGYYSFEDSARKYVKDLYDDIRKNLPKQQHKPAPNYYDKEKSCTMLFSKKTNTRIIMHFFQSIMIMGKQFI